jgi:hypothetical protein
MITPALDTAALDIRLDALLAALSRAQRGNKTLHRAERRGFAKEAMAAVRLKRRRAPPRDLRVLPGKAFFRSEVRNA